MLCGRLMTQPTAGARSAHAVTCIWPHLVAGDAYYIFFGKAFFAEPPPCVFQRLNFAATRAVLFQLFKALITRGTNGTAYAVSSDMSLGTTAPADDCRLTSATTTATPLLIFFAYKQSSASISSMAEGANTEHFFLHNK